MIEFVTAMRDLLVDQAGWDTESVRRMLSHFGHETIRREQEEERDAADQLSPAEKEAKAQILPLAWTVKEQWEKARPQMMKDLEVSGRLYQTLEETGRRGAAMYERLRGKGLTHEEAMELVEDDLYKLPEENQTGIGGPVVPYS